MSCSAFSSSAREEARQAGREAGREGGDGGGGRHSPFRHIFSQSLIFAFFLFLKTVYTPLRTTTYEVANFFFFLGVMAVAVVNILHSDCNRNL